ncbi:MarR family winged helix-turn-helix transcriptional regulator [Paenibacillus validus]|uniref:Winged helix DNA-binding protein n=1 Tax=Paenibacillus validus TaxID=44253 RepID=A0A7X3CVU5_9BACL|nr:MarR family transcriptional regulator [Paenibacillus validus]MUG73449.1 winged helix DNA-binding protein [Paenibacillus validus]
MDQLHASSPIEKWTRLVMRKWHADMSVLLKQGLPIQQYYMLEVLRDGRQMKSSAIAESLHVTLPAITNLTQKLVSGGYVERILTEADRRVVYVRITEKGLEALKELDDAAAGLVERFWSRLEPAEVDELTRLLCKAMQPKE